MDTEMENQEQEQDENQPLRFKKKRKERVVIIEDENGQEQSYTLKELSGEERDMYMNSVGKKSEQEGGKVVKVKDFMGTCSDLLCHCLFTAKGQKVSAAEIQKFPTSMQVALFEAAAKLSGLDKKAEDKAKNA